MNEMTSKWAHLKNAPFFYFLLFCRQNSSGQKNLFHFILLLFFFFIAFLEVNNKICKRGKKNEVDVRAFHAVKAWCLNEFVTSPAHGKEVM